MNKDLKSFYDRANKFKSENNLSLPTLFEEGINNIVPAYEKLEEIIAEKKFNQLQGTVPSIVKNFILKYVEDKKKLSMLDPWCEYGEMFYPLMERMENGVGIFPNKKTLKVAEKLLDKKRVEIINDEPRMTMKSVENEFDLVFCDLLTLASIKRASPSNRQTKEKLEHLILIESSLKLKEEGKAFYIVPENFFNSVNKKEIFSLLNKSNLHLDAAFSLPSGSLYNTSLSSYLLVVSKEKFPKLFVGEISEEHSLEPLIANWKRRQSGKLLALGCLTEVGSFESYKNLEYDLEIQRLLRKTRLSPAKIKDIYLKVVPYKKEEINRIEDAQNAIYLSQYLSRDVSSKLSELEESPIDGFQVILDNTKVSAEYMAGWFNTKLGRLVRKKASSGNIISRITKTNLMNLTVYLPEYDQQIRSMHMHTKITNLRSELDSIETRVWEDPLSLQTTSRELGRVNKSPNISEWIEVLPFPLASILWKYYATKAPKEKVDYLLYFFEAFAQFEVIIMLSAFSNDKQTIPNDRLVIDIEKIKRSTFGNWVVIGEHLAKKTRSYISSNDSEERCKRMFKHDREFIETICSKPIFRILNKTCEYRNDWRGHGGIEGSKLALQRLRLLEAELSELRNTIGNTFEYTTMVTPITGSFEQGIYNCKCKLLKGSNQDLKEILVNTQDHIEKNELYLLEDGQSTPLRLIPLMQMVYRERTDTNVFYFFNRLQGEEVKMKSYYYAQEPNITLQDDRIINSIIDIAQYYEKLAE